MSNEHDKQVQVTLMEALCELFWNLAFAWCNYGKSRKSSRQDNRCPGRDSNRGSPNTSTGNYRYTNPPSSKVSEKKKLSFHSALHPKQITNAFYRHTIFGGAWYRGALRTGSRKKTRSPYAFPISVLPLFPLWVLAFLFTRMFTVIPLASNNRFGLHTSWGLEGNKEYGEWERKASGVGSATIHGTSFRGLMAGSLKSTIPPPHKIHEDCVTQNNPSSNFPSLNQISVVSEIKPSVCQARATASQRWGWGNGGMRINRTKLKKFGETRLSFQSHESRDEKLALMSRS
jgi:hypothetical protein